MPATLGTTEIALRIERLSTTRPANRARDESRSRRSSTVLARVRAPHWWDGTTSGRPAPGGGYADRSHQAGSTGHDRHERTSQQTKDCSPLAPGISLTGGRTVGLRFIRSAFRHEVGGTTEREGGADSPAWCELWRRRRAFAHGHLGLDRCRVLLAGLDLVRSGATGCVLLEHPLGSRTRGRRSLAVHAAISLVIAAAPRGHLGDVQPPLLLADLADPRPRGGARRHTPCSCPRSQAAVSRRWRIESMS